LVGANVPIKAGPNPFAEADRNATPAVYWAAEQETSARVDATNCSRQHFAENGAWEWRSHQHWDPRVWYGKGDPPVNTGQLIGECEQRELAGGTGGRRSIQGDVYWDLWEFSNAQILRSAQVPQLIEGHAIRHLRSMVEGIRIRRDATDSAEHNTQRPSWNW
jgi:hypothetical protein